MKALNSFKKHLKKFRNKKGQGQSLFDNWTEFTFIINNVFQLEDIVIDLYTKTWQDTKRVDKIANMIEFICAEEGFEQDELFKEWYKNSKAKKNPINMHLKNDQTMMGA